MSIVRTFTVRYKLLPKNNFRNVKHRPSLPLSELRQIFGSSVRVLDWMNPVEILKTKQILKIKTTLLFDNNIDLAEQKLTACSILLYNLLGEWVEYRLSV